jgi:hypothetical protein
MTRFLVVYETNKGTQTKFKQPQNGVRLSLKPTPRSKGDKTKEKHRKGKTHVKIKQPN